jgi:hypothetical protein
LLLRLLFQIRQTGPVNEYIEQFVALVDDLKAYVKHPDPLYYSQCFIDGLHDEIKSVVLVQRPSTLDTACVLAQLQEEVLGSAKRNYRRIEVGSASWPEWTRGLPLPPPPPKPAVCDVKQLTTTPPSSAEEKFQPSELLVVPKVSAFAVVPNGAEIISVLSRFSYTWCKNCWICFLIQMKQMSLARALQLHPRL